MSLLADRKSLVWAGIVLISLTGIIHLVEAPEYFGEYGAFWGLSFVANFLGAVAAAYGIYRGQSWGWTLGILVAGGAFVAYLLSRTVGLPGLASSEFFETIGIASLVVEGLFVAFAARALSRAPQASSSEA
jgi:hypothetical protein